MIFHHNSKLLPVDSKNPDEFVVHLRLLLKIFRGTTLTSTFFCKVTKSLLFTRSD